MQNWSADRIIAAGAEGMAPHHPTDGHGETDNRTVFLDSLQGVLRAGWYKTTGRRFEGGEVFSISAYDEKKRGLHPDHPYSANILARSLS